MKLPLAYYGNPILRKKTKPIEKITAEVCQLVKNMEETLVDVKGVGLAAPQVHQNISLFITMIPKMVDDEVISPGTLRVFINPKILSFSKEIWTCQEGCLSIPEFWDEVPRPHSVVMQATNLEGEIFEEEFKEFEAHVIMHENDHLNGVLFIDRLPLKRKKEIEKDLKKIKKNFSFSKK